MRTHSELYAPVLMTDAGSRRPWFQTVEAGGTTREAYAVGIGIATIKANKQLYLQATSTVRSLGLIEMTHSAPYVVPLYCMHRPPIRRKRCSIARSKLSRQNAWLLASNLAQSQWTARQIVGIYRKRMQIEPGFRGLKSLRFGFAFDLHLACYP